jgi:exodeoxyribonuclease-5
LRYSAASEQERALADIRSWVRDDERQIYKLFGPAGSGKTTIAAQFAADGVHYAALAGKAALVLRQKGCVGASTVHSLIYRLVDEDEKRRPVFVLDSMSPARSASLIVLDEVSMIPRKMALDLLSFGSPILAIGDPYQLPPIDNESGYFTRGKPNTLLTEIHRQQAGSTVLELATFVREHRREPRHALGL